MRHPRHCRQLQLQHKAAAAEGANTACALARGRQQARAQQARDFARSVALQLVQLAERSLEYRAATAGQPPPQREWREWVTLFVAGAGTSSACTGLLLHPHSMHGYAIMQWSTGTDTDN